MWVAGSLARFYRQPRLYSNACVLAGRNFSCVVVWTTLVRRTGNRATMTSSTVGGSGLRDPAMQHSQLH